MAQQKMLSLLDEARPDRTRPHAPAPDPAMATALAYEQAVLDCLESFRNPGHLRAQAEACVRFEAAMAAYMALPQQTYARTKRALDRRGRITGQEWRQINARMETLSRLPTRRLS